MQRHKFFPADRCAKCILVFLRWLVRTLGLRGPPHGEPALYSALGT